MIRTLGSLFGVCVCFATGTAIAATPMDRPSPPPRCVDGICIPHPQTYGYFQTRWRVWPGLGEAPAPTGPTAPTVKIEGVPPYEMPPPEKEDLKAPPQTKSAPEKSAIELPTGTTPPAKVLEPGVPNVTLPSGGPQPHLPQQQPFPPQSTLPQPVPPQSTAPRPTTAPLGEGKPLGDLDPPPAPRLATARAAQPIATSRFTAPVAAPPTARSYSAAGYSGSRSAQRNDGDPPPPPPLSLGGASL